MLTVGEQDHNTPPAEAERFYAALHLRGVPTELVVIPDAGHVSIAGTPSRLIARASLMLDWFARHGGVPLRKSGIAFRRTVPRPPGRNHGGRFRAWHPDRCPPLG